MFHQEWEIEQLLQVCKRKIHYLEFGMSFEEKYFTKIYSQEWEIDQLLQFCRRNFIFPQTVLALEGFLLVM